MVKDMLDESSFDASPAHVLPGRVLPGRIGEAVSGVVGKLRDSADAQHHDENNS